eukprot:14433496-Alexandrium_andersonii.AAC.2
MLGMLASFSCSCRSSAAICSLNSIFVMGASGTSTPRTPLSTNSLCPRSPRTRFSCAGSAM